MESWQPGSIVMYAVLPRAYQDSNGDGIGDLGGVLQRLDYLQQLGVTCVWILPFFPSGGRDNGYDITNYTAVSPEY
jgi:maltose alpha-D-glucosyltransferase/alpha-amylase